MPGNARNLAAEEIIPKSGQINEKKTVEATSRELSLLNEVFFHKLRGNYEKVNELIRAFFENTPAHKFGPFHEALLLLLTQTNSLQGTLNQSLQILSKLGAFSDSMEQDFFVRWALEMKELAAQTNQPGEYLKYHTLSGALGKWILRAGNSCSTLEQCAGQIFPPITRKDLAGIPRFPFDDTLKWLPAATEELNPPEFFGERWESGQSVWAYTEIHNPQRGPVRFYLGLEGACLVWIDGKLSFIHDFPHSYNNLQFAFTVQLGRGSHSIQVLLLEKRRNIRFSMRAFLVKKRINSISYDKWQLKGLNRVTFGTDLAYWKNEKKGWEDNFLSYPYFLHSPKGTHPLLLGLLIYFDNLYSDKFPLHKKVLEQYLTLTNNANFINDANQKNIMLQTAARYYLVLFTHDLNVRKKLLSALLRSIGDDKSLVEIFFQDAKLQFSFRLYNDFFEKLTRIIGQKPDFIPALKARVSYFRQRGWIREALEALDSWAKHRPPSHHFFSEKSLLYKKVHFQGERQEALERLLKMDLFSSDVEGELEKIYKKNGNNLKYVRLLTNKTILSSSAWFYQRLIGEYREALGNFSGALHYFGMVLRAKPFDHRVHLALARINNSLNSPGMVNFHLQMAKKLSPSSKNVQLAVMTLINDPGRPLKDRKSPESLEPFLPYLVHNENSVLLDDLNFRYNQDMATHAKFSRAVSENSAEYLWKEKITLIHKGGKRLEYHRQVARVLDKNGVKTFSTRSMVYSPQNEKIFLLEASVRNPSALKGSLTFGSYETIHSDSNFEQSLSDPASRLYYDSKAKVYVMPSVQVGSIIVFAYIKEVQKDKNFGEYVSDHFSPSGEYPVYQAKYTLVNESSTPLHYKLKNRPGDFQESLSDGKKIYKLNAKLIGSLPRIDFPPPLNYFQKEVIFTSFQNWQELGIWMHKLVMDRFALSPKLMDFSRTLKRDFSSEEYRIRKILHWVTARIRYVGLEYGIGGYQPRMAMDVAATGFGDCKDMSTLAVGLLRESGIEAHVALVRTRDRGPVDQDIPFLGAFNHAIIHINYLTRDSRGKRVRRDLFFDATSDFSGFGELPWSDQEVTAFILSEKPHFHLIPKSTSDANATLVKNLVKLETDGTLLIKRSLVKSGQYAIAARESYQNPSQRMKIIKDFWNQAYPDNKLSNLHFSDLEDKPKPVSYSYEIILKNYLEKIEGFFLFKPFMFTTDLLQTYAMKPKRKYPLHFYFASRTEVHTRIFYPAEWKVYHLPKEIKRQSPFGEYGFKFELQLQQGKKILLIHSWIDLKEEIIPVSEYALFRDFCAEVDEKERDWIIFQH